MNHGDDLKEKVVEKRRALLAQLGGWNKKEMKITGWSATVKRTRSRGVWWCGGWDKQEERKKSTGGRREVAGFTFLALEERIYVVLRGAEVRGSSAVTGLLNILLLKQNGRPNIKDTRWCSSETTVNICTLFKNLWEKINVVWAGYSCIL